MKDILSEIVDRAIRKVLSESNLGGTNYLYHFTSIPNLVSIMDTGSLYLSGNEGGRNGDFYFCSLTRSKMGNEGYSNHLPVRITFNADILRRINGVRIRPFNYFQHSNGFCAPDEREERLLCPSRVIKVEDAIDRIDVFVSGKLSGRLSDSDIYRVFSGVIGKYMRKVHFYKDKNAFDSMDSDSAIDWHYIVMGAEYEGNDSSIDVGNYRTRGIRSNIDRYNDRNKYFRKDIHGNDSVDCSGNDDDRR